MDPAVRVLRQITLDDAAAADELFSILMGDDVEARRSFITRNAKDVRFLTFSADFSDHRDRHIMTDTTLPRAGLPATGSNRSTSSRRCRTAISITR